MSTKKEIQPAYDSFIEDGHSAYLEGRYQAADSLYRLALTGLEANPEPQSMSRLSFLFGELCAEQGRTAEAEEWLRKALDILGRQNCPLDVDVAVVLKSLSDVCRAQGQTQQALLLKEQAEKQLCFVRRSLEWQYCRPPARSADAFLLILFSMLTLVWLLTGYIVINREHLPGLEVIQNMPAAASSRFGW